MALEIPCGSIMTHMVASNIVRSVSMCILPGRSGNACIVPRLSFRKRGIAIRSGMKTHPIFRRHPYIDNPARDGLLGLQRDGLRRPQGRAGLLTE